MSDDDPGRARHVHPGTIALRMAQGLPSTLLGLPALYAVMSGRGLVWLVPLILIVMAIGMGVGALKWWHFTYQLTPDELRIAEGILTTSRRSIPLDRIQDVSIEQKPVARLFGLATVKIETAGGERDEAVLDMVALAEAERLRRVLREERGAAAGAVTEAADVADQTVFAMGVGRVLTLGLFRFSLVWIAALAGLFQFADQFIGFDIARWIGSVGEAEREIERQLSIGLGVAALAAAVAVGVVTGVVTTLLRDYDYRVTERDGRFSRRRGLLTRSENAIARSRIQLGLIERGWVRRRFGWAALKVQTLGGSDEPGGRQDLAPLATSAEIEAIVRECGLPPFEPLALNPVAFAHVIRAIVRRVAVPLIAIVIVAIWVPKALFAMLLLPIPVGVALLARRHHRYAARATSLQVARGVLTHREWILPYRSIQTVTMLRSPLQRALGIATIKVATAGAAGGQRPYIVDLSLGDAVALIGSVRSAIAAAEVSEPASDLASASVA